MIIIMYTAKLGAVIIWLFCLLLYVLIRILLIIIMCLINYVGITNVITGIVSKHTL